MKGGMLTPPRRTVVATTRTAAASSISPLRTSRTPDMPPRLLRRGFASDTPKDPGLQVSAGHLSPWASRKGAGGRGTILPEHGKPMLPEANMLLRRASILLEEDCMTDDEFRVAKHSASTVITKGGEVDSDVLNTLRQLVKRGMDRKADSAQQARDRNPTPLDDVKESPDFKTAPRSGTQCVVS